jgi:hypothetical protein
MNQNPPPTSNGPSANGGQPASGPVMGLWAISVIAGLVSAVLFASAATGTLLGTVVLFFLSPLPVATAGIGWGWRAAAMAAGVAALALTLGLGPRVGFGHAIVIGLPSVLMTYYLMLNRWTGDTHAVSGAPVIEWYPLGRVITGLALFAAVLTTISLLSIGTDLETLKAPLRQAVERDLIPALEAGAKRRAGVERSPARIEELTMVLISVLQVLMVLGWFTFGMLNLWLAAVVTRKSDRLDRPWPDLSMIALPPSLMLAFAVTVALSFSGGMPGLLATSFAVAILLAYMLVGLAIIHNITRSLSIRSGLLAALYLALALLFLLVAPLIALLALAEPLLPIRRSAASGAAAGPNAPPPSFLPPTN